MVGWMLALGLAWADDTDASKSGTSLPADEPMVPATGFTGSEEATPLLVALPTPTSVGVVMIQAIGAGDNPSTSQAQVVFTHGLPGLDRCARTHPVENDLLVETASQVLASGIVKTVVVTGLTGDLKTCFEREISLWPFAPSPGEATISARFLVEPP